MSQTPVDARQVVPFEARTSGGQVLLTPLQLSAMSHAPAAGRQTAVLLASAGQAALVPVQFSVRSQAPAEARQTTVAGWKASAGQTPLMPSQVSAASQAPAEG